MSTEDICRSLSAPLERETFILEGYDRVTKSSATDMFMASGRGGNGGFRGQKASHLSSSDWRSSAPVWRSVGIIHVGIKKKML